MVWNASRVFRIGVIDFPPYCYVKTDKVTGAPVSYHGPYVRTLLEILTSLDIRYSLHAKKGDFTGTRNASGHWSGVIGRAYRDEVDVGIYGSMSSDRDEVVRFSIFTTKIPLPIMGGVPATSSGTSVLRLALVFENQIWILLFISMIFLIITSCFIVKKDFHLGVTSLLQNFEDSYYQVYIRVLQKKEIYFIIFCYFSALFSEGTPRAPESSHGRFLYGIWWLVMLVLANGFCGIMKATMMAPERDNKIRDVTHLATMLQEVQPITIDNSAMLEFFKFGTSTAQQDIYKALRTGGGLVPLSELVSEESVLKVSRGKAVIIAGAEYLQISTETFCKTLDIHNLYFARDEIFYAYAVLMYNKNLPTDLIKAIDKRIIRYREGSIIDKWMEMEIGIKSYCFTGVVETNLERPLSLNEIGGLFKLLIVCLVFSAGILLLEKAAVRFQKLFMKR